MSSKAYHVGNHQGTMDGESFPGWFPTATAGDGAVRPNNARPGKDQPDARPSPKRKAACKRCGMLNDKTKVASDGGSLDGSGAGGIVRIDSQDNDSTVGDQAWRAGAGCKFCYSKDWAAGGNKAEI